MNRLITILLFLFLSYNIYSQDSRGVNFRKGYTEALKLAEIENKLLFIYLHVPDCEACDRLSESFKNKSISKLYNEHYVSFSLDANGEGKKIAENYGVFSYPTLIYLTPEGEIKFSAKGYRDGNSIFEIGKLARLSNRKIRKKMAAKYKLDRKDTDHLYDYIEYNFVSAKYLKFEKLLKEYLDQKDLTEKTTWMHLVLDFASDHQSYAHSVLIAEKDAFSNEFGEGYINEIIWNSLINKVGEKYSTSRITHFEKKFIKEVVEAGYDPKDEGLIAFYSEYLFSSNVTRESEMPSTDMAIFTKYALDAIDIKGHIFNPEHLIALGIHLITFYQKDDGLLKLYDVLESNFEIESLHMYLDLQSVALYLMGKEDEAIKKIVTARELAFSQGDVNFKPSILVFKELGIVK